MRAHVNGREVHQSAVDAVRAEARFDSRSDDAGKALDEAIDRELVRQEAERLGVSADQAEVDKHARHARGPAGGEKALASLLEQARMTRKQLLGSLTYGVLREAVQDARYADVGVGEAKVRRFYDAESEGPVHEARGRAPGRASFARNEGIAANALKRIAPGPPLRPGLAAVLHRSASSRTPAARWAGSHPRRSPRASRKAVDGLRVGEMSQPVQGMGGWYVFKVLGRRAATVDPVRGGP